MKGGRGWWCHTGCRGGAQGGSSSTHVTGNVMTGSKPPYWVKNKKNRRGLRLKFGRGRLMKGFKSYKNVFLSMLSALYESSSSAVICWHCTENPIYVFPEMKLHGIVSDLFIPRIGLPIWLPQV
jgi:hypothetical protein